MSHHKIVVAQLGQRLDYMLPHALDRAGCLERLFTDIFLSPREFRYLNYFTAMKWFRGAVAKALTRHNAAIDFNKVTRFTKLGVRYVKALRRVAGSATGQYRAYMRYGGQFNDAILRRGLPEATHLYAYDHAALGLFRKTNAKHTKLILEQIYPALHAERLEQEEETSWPGWATEPRGLFYQSSVFKEWREIQLEEWRLASIIIVASRYTQRAIEEIAPEIATKLRKVPLTVNLDAYVPYQHVRRYPAGRPLRVLYVGNVNLRKGLPYLLTAFNGIDPSVARLTVVGGIYLNEEKIKAFQDRVGFLGALPHSWMPQIYHDADVFVFPTISDGFGAVMLEAMATGLPVISTDHCADIVEDGVNGLRIPIRSPEAIVDRISQLVRNPEILEHLSAGAIKTSQRFSLANHQAALCRALDIEALAAG